MDTFLKSSLQDCRGTTHHRIHPTKNSQEMGSSNSTERLAVPLHAPSKPFLAATNGYVLEAATKMRINTMPFNATRKISHTETNEVFFEIKNHAFTSRQTLQTPDGKVRLGIKSHTLSRGKFVYDGDQTDQHSYRIDSKINVTSADFVDCSTGEACRVVIDGKSSDEVALVYLERGGSSLPPLDMRAERASTRFQAIGRIQQQNREYTMEAMPGVDVTLLVLLWLVHTDSSD